MKKSWCIRKYDAASVQQVCEKYHCHPIVAAILSARRMNETTDLQRFFFPAIEDMRPPFAIRDMDIAVERIYKAIRNKETILIFGDYDADGVTATALLYEFLSYAGADVRTHIPHRVREGYGLHPFHILQYPDIRKANLIITVDCGISSHDAVQTARSYGIDVIITDHHQVPERLPDAVGVINPRREDCKAGFDELAGVGVAFCLVICLRAYFREHHFWENKREPNLKSLCDLVSIGTVADMVPLVDENRILAKAGIDLINSGNRMGIHALVKASAMKDKTLGSQDVAFKLAPRINAAGRMAHAGIALELLMTQNRDRAFDLAAQLNRLNMQRQQTEKAVIDQIFQQLEQFPELLERKTLVLSHPNWHEGILGIAASKTAERLFRPVVLISTRNGFGKGSARSIPGVNLYNALKACSGALDGFGGHEMAAGIKIRKQNIDDFRDMMEAAVSDSTCAEDFYPVVTADYDLSFHEISPELIDGIETLNPFGQANPEPLFIAKSVEVLSCQIVGGSHRKMLLRQPSPAGFKTMQAIEFNNPQQVEKGTILGHIAFHLRWNCFNGIKRPQIIITDS